MRPKAEYLFQPHALVRRLLTRNRPGGVKTLSLPWGRSITVDTRDNIGSAVAVLGVFDLIVTESLWRLTEPGELVLDVGANIGCMTAALAERVGPAGRVVAFEPHPLLFDELTANVRGLRAQGITAEMDARQMALGLTPGILPLHVPSDFLTHRGESSLAAIEHLEQARDTYEVEVRSLDGLFPIEKIGVVKLDVEGFELEVLRGGESLFGTARVRDCVFEEHRSYPTEVTNAFERWGYRVFRLARGLFRPHLVHPSEAPTGRQWEATSYLATTDPDRALGLMRKGGWKCLRRQPIAAR